MSILRKTLIFITGILFGVIPLGGIVTFALGLSELAYILNFLERWVTQFGIFGSIILGYYFGFLRHRYEEELVPRDPSTKEVIGAFGYQLLDALRDVQRSDPTVEVLKRSVDEWIAPEREAARISDVYVSALKEEFKQALS